MLHWLKRQARNWKRHLGTLAIALTALLAVQAWQTRNVNTGHLSEAVLQTPVVLLMPGQAEQSLTFQTALQQLQDERKQPVALYLWADWCPICRTLRSTANSFSQDYPTLSIAMRSGPPSQVQRYLQQHQLTWPTLVDTSGALTRTLGFNAVPSFAIVTPKLELQTPTVGLTSSWGMRLRWWWAQLTR